MRATGGSRARAPTDPYRPGHSRVADPARRVSTGSAGISTSRHAKGIEVVWIEAASPDWPEAFEGSVNFVPEVVAGERDTETLRPFAEAGIWGAIRHHGLVGDAVIVSDDAGQFRVGTHALCWVHAERLLQKLMPATPGQVKHVETLRELIWHLYKALSLSTKASPSYGQGPAGSLRPVSIRTGYSDLDKLLFRLRRHKPELLMVLERPEIPLHTNASERDLRGFVIKRKISGGTVSRNGRQVRDSMLGLSKTCQKLGLSFWHYLGDRLEVGTSHPAIP